MDRGLHAIRFGTRDVGRSTPPACSTRSASPPRDRAAFTAWQVRALRLAASAAYPFDETAAAERSGRAFDRGYDPLGIQGQDLAVPATGDRTECLRSLRVPLLVAHGTADIGKLVGQLPCLQPALA
ncbi:hypothetical protein ABTY96_06195 [Streptomyces sp. NPDC096057]|uniref:hypothetical protein n=1 Tax=Streptomyces sp. NPDC096057 TaxID=3155543 RepID=UPI00331BF3D7